MKVKYKGNYPIKFVSLKGFSGIVNPNDVIEIDSDIYNAQYKGNSNFESVKNKKGAE